jgi:hypothetical protein
VELAHLLLQQALIAKVKLQSIFEKAGAEAAETQTRVIEEQPEAAFYSGKIHTTEFFISNILPKVQSTVAMILGGNRSALTIPEAAF